MALPANTSSPTTAQEEEVYRNDQRAEQPREERVMEADRPQGERDGGQVQEQYELEEMRQAQAENEARPPRVEPGMRRRRANNTSDETAHTLYLPRAFEPAEPAKYVLGFFESVRDFWRMMKESLFDFGSEERINMFLTIVLVLALLVTFIIWLVKKSDEAWISLAMILLGFLKLKFEHFMDGWSQLVSLPCICCLEWFAKFHR